MKQKDVAILFVVTLAILVSLYYQGSYYALQLTWVHPIDASLYKNGRFPQEHETLFVCTHPRTHTHPHIHTHSHALTRPVSFFSSPSDQLR